MKKIIALVVLAFTMAMPAQGSDLVCSCQAPDTCPDIRIRFVPATTGTYLSIEYAYGDRNQEGFAVVTRKGDETVYNMGQFTIVEKDNKYALPGKLQQCN